ncbi:hypothetical protein GCM10009663_57020 [Kitasatospora arboriphila]|uniref:Uncharacterized protein n=1 Tax=Kitasatospora arboriphila TaxID=258052 RepID=A0ABP4EGB7_9ACTN
MPPPPTWEQRIRSRWAERHALGRLPYWLLTRASWVLGLCAALFVLNAVLLNSAAKAYDVMIGITSPADPSVDPHWSAWLLSVAGWGAIPAFVGAMVGYLVTDQVQTHQAEPLEEVLRRLRELSQPPTPPPGGGA